MSEKEPKGVIREIGGKKILDPKENKGPFVAPESGPVATREQIKVELKKIDKAWGDALERLQIGEETQIVDASLTGGDPVAIEKYLDEHPELTDEARHFLRISIETKKLLKKLDAAETQREKLKE